jgi:hypothetical protein
MYYYWIEWMMETHDFDYKLPISQWGFNKRTQYAFCDAFIYQVNH